METMKSFDPSKPLKQVKAEQIARLTFEHPELSQQEVGERVGFSKQTANVQVCRLLSNPQVSARISWLMSQAASDAILTVIKRKEVLSKIIEEIGGHDPADYITSDQDGVNIRFDKTSKNRQAVAGIKSRQEFNSDGDPIATVTDLKLRDPTIAIRAIDTLNRMEGIYNDDKDQARVQVVLIVQTADGQPKQIAGLNQSGYLTPPPVNPLPVEPGRLKYVNSPTFAGCK